MNLSERLIQDWGTDDVDPVLFYKPSEDFGEFSAWSRHPVCLPNPWTDERTKYITAEHRFQSMKALSEVDHNFVQSAKTAHDAKERGGPRGIELRPDWGNTHHDLCYLAMLEASIAKAIQNQAVFNALLDTGDRPIYEDSWSDDIWGIQFHGDYRGKNLLGRCWMQVRDLLV